MTKRGLSDKLHDHIITNKNPQALRPQSAEPVRIISRNPHTCTHGGGKPLDVPKGGGKSIGPGTGRIRDAYRFEVSVLGQKRHMSSANQFISLKIFVFFQKFC